MPGYHAISQQQLELHGDSERLAEWGGQHPEVFSGLWFDNELAEEGRGPVRLTLAVLSGTDPAIVQEALGVLRHTDRAVVVERDHTLGQLERLHQDVVEHVVGRERNTRGTAVSAVGCDLVRGVVVVSLSQVDQQLADQLLSCYAGRPIEIEQGVRVVPVQH